MIGLKTEAGTVVAAGVVAAEAKKQIDADIVAAEAGIPIDADTVAAEAAAETEEAATDDIEVPAVRGETTGTDAVEAEKSIAAVTVEVEAEAEAEREVVEVLGREAGAQRTKMIGIKNKPAVKTPATRKESKMMM